MGFDLFEKLNIAELGEGVAGDDGVGTTVGGQAKKMPGKMMSSLVQVLENDANLFEKMEVAELGQGVAGHVDGPWVWQMCTRYPNSYTLSLHPYALNPRP